MPDPQAPLRSLRQLSDEMGEPSAGQLWFAVRKKGLMYSKKVVEAFVKEKGEKQVFQAVQPAKGKTVSESLDARWQIDLIVFTKQPAAISGVTYRYILVAINVFDRYIYGRAMRTKEQSEVRLTLEQILEAAKQKPKLISSDQGQEFQGIVTALLAQKNIAHKLKAVGDVNGIGVVDKAIQSLKQKLSQMVAVRGTWVSNLPRALAGINNTPKPGVLHGAAPKEIREDDQHKFLLLQDQAQNMKHNTALGKRRKEKLQSTGVFRAPLPESTGKFKRSYHATYGEPLQMADVTAGTVTDSTGNKHNLKSIKVIPANSSRVGVGLGANEKGPEKKRQLGGAIITMLAILLEGAEEGRLSISRAAAQLKVQMRLDGQDYAAVLKKSGAIRLIDLIRIADDRFTLVEQPHGPQTWYYVELVE
jgi:transposase InsO family protein